MKTVTIPLSKPLVGHEGELHEIKLREPSAADFFALGEPSTWSSTKDGAAVYVELTEVIGQYADRCLMEPANKLLLAQLGLADGFRVRDAITGFFRDARKATSQTAATSSSSS